MKLIELIGVLDPNGTKKISIKYDDVNDILLIEDNGISKEITTGEIQSKIDDIYNKLNSLNIDIKSINILPNSVIGVRVRKKYPILTRFEEHIRYRYYCMTHNFGQGEGKMFDNWSYIPFDLVESTWNKIRNKYLKDGWTL